MNYLTKISLWCIVLCSVSASPLAAQTPIIMKQLNVKKINAEAICVARLPELLDSEGVEFQSIDVVNWDAFPYCPTVSFRIAYTDSAMLLHYKVREESVRARYAADNSPVYKDSCVECFISPAEDDIYYNLEINSIGTIILGGGAPGSRVRALPEVTATVDRWASLGNEPFEERIGEVEWEVALVVPYTAFFKHQITSLEGKSIRANFYKCGDELRTSHYVSWNAIGTEKPSFHQPAYFGTLKF